MWRRETQVRPLAVGLVFLAIGVSLLPVAALALAIDRNAKQHVVASMPNIEDLMDVLKPRLVVGVVAGAAVASWWSHWRRKPNPVSHSSWILLVASWLTLPFCLYLISHASGNSVFLMRYLYLALPGLILTTVALVAVFVPSIYWHRMALIMGAGVVIFCGHWSYIWPAHHNSNWRAAARSINAAGLGEDIPILCPSPFIESRPPVWSPDSPPSGFFYSYLQVYPIHGRPVPLPFEDAPGGESRAVTLSNGELPDAHRFLIYGGGKAVNMWTTWFQARPELSGWKHRSLGNFGDVYAILFESTSTASAK